MRFRKRLGDLAGRLTFAAKVTAAISKEPLIKIRREEFTEISEDAVTVLATGPLTSDALSQEIGRLSGSTNVCGEGDSSNLQRASHQNPPRRIHRNQRGCGYRPGH